MRRVFDWMYSFSSITYMLMGTPLTSLEQFPITISEDASRLSSSVKVAELCPTLCDPMHCIVRGILQARTLEWVAFPFSRGSSQSRDWTQVSRIAGGFFTSWATGEALISPQIKLQFTSLTSLTWYIFISVDTLGWEKFLNTEDTYLFCCIFFFFLIVWLYACRILVLQPGIELKPSERESVNAGDARDVGSISGSRRFPGAQSGNSLQYSCLENSMDRGAWLATVHGTAESWTRLSDRAHIYKNFGSESTES